MITSWGSPMRVLDDGRVLTLESDVYNLRLTISSAQEFADGVYDDDY